MTEEPRMTTTEPTTTAEVPAWLNLDGYCPPKLRERILQARCELAAARPAIEELGKRLAELNLDVQAHFGTIDCSIDDHWFVLDRWTGIDSLHNEILECGDLLNIAAGERIQDNRPTPEWYLDLLQERVEHLSTWAPSKLREEGRDIPKTPAEIERDQTMDPELLARIQGVRS
jgi:hypothetical protein